MRLGDLAVGRSGCITEVGGEGALRHRLLDMGLTPRTRVTVRKLAPMGDPIQLSLRGYELTLRREDADKITICPDHEGAGCGCERGRGHRFRREGRGRRER